MITVRVGGLSRFATFHVPEKAIRASSQFVDAAMKGPWKESEERLISLPDHNDKAFGIYLQWLLTGKLYSKVRATTGYPDKRAVDKPNDGQIQSALCSEILPVTEPFDLAHYLMEVDFRDTLNDALTQCSVDLQSIETPFPMTFVPRLYNVVPDGLPTRQLLADLGSWVPEARYIKKLCAQGEELQTDFLIDLVEAMALRFMSDTPGSSPLEGWETSCKYHCHGDEKPCYREKSKRYADPLHTHSGVLY
jgi:hypothetical protein